MPPPKFLNSSTNTQPIQCKLELGPPFFGEPRSDLGCLDSCIYISKGQGGLNDIPGDVHGKTMSVDPDHGQALSALHTALSHLERCDEMVGSVYILVKQCAVDMDLLMSSRQELPSNRVNVLEIRNVYIRL
jgi:hypothetical protein